MRGEAVASPTALPTSTRFRDELFALQPDDGGAADPAAQRVYDFRAEVLNAYVAENRIRSVIEFGCGDGLQLAQASYPAYIGLDVSRTAVLRCKERFAGDTHKSFFLCDPLAWVDHHQIFRADLALSVDVICYLLEDEMFHAHLAQLFAAAQRAVIVYSTNTDTPGKASHVRHRRFTDRVIQERPDWSLVRTIANRFPFEKDNPLGAPAEFFIFERRRPHTPRDTTPA
jgi:hypothetical protein